MAPPARRLSARALRAGVSACAATALLLLALLDISPAHEGHDHGAPPASAEPVLRSPRVVATSDRYQFVGIVEGEVLVVYLDRAGDNAPVTSATMEVSLDGEPHKAEFLPKTATYEVAAPLLRKGGQHAVLVAIADGDAHDLLVGTLDIPAPAAEAGEGRRMPDAVAEAILLLVGGRQMVTLAGIVLLAAAAGGAVLGRRRLLIVPMAALGLILTSALAWAHEGPGHRHDHGPDLSAAAGNAPARRPDGTLFVPKPTQRLLEIRTQVASIETRARTERLQGRIVPDPNRSGVVQSTLQGRYEAPEGGVPRLGARVKAGDLMGRVAPSFASIDASDMMQTLGTIDQEIALARRRLARQERLLASNAVAKAAVEDTRIQLAGLEKRRSALLAARVRPEKLRAPVDGVIAAQHVTVGQVVSPSDKLFEIIDPASLMVEALVFDQVDPVAVRAATASVGGEAVIRLKLIGRSRMLQQQYSVLRFRITQSPVALNAGAPVTVFATTAKSLTGFVLPSSAVAHAPNGQPVVFSQREPEVFAPRAVRVELFDSDSVLITAGIEPGERIVVRNAPLLNQVR